MSKEELRAQWFERIKAYKASGVTQAAFCKIETAKENGLNPFKYLMYLFEKLPNIDTSDMKVLDELLPWSEALQSLTVYKLKLYKYYIQLPASFRGGEFLTLTLRRLWYLKEKRLL